MKKVFAGVVLPVVAAAAIIGSGFSVWFFGENEVKASADATVEVTNLLRIGDLEMKKTGGKLVLDQTAAVREYIAENRTSYTRGETTEDSNKDEASKLDTDKTNKTTGFEAKGIYFTKGTDAADDFDGKITYTAPNSNDKLGSNYYMDEIESVAKLQIVTTITFSDAKLAKYIDVVAPATDATVTRIETTKDNSIAFLWNDTTGKDSYERVLPMDGNAGSFVFNYAADESVYTSKRNVGIDATKDTKGVLKTAEPHDTAEYNQMVNDVKGTKVTIETVATIVEA